MYTVARQVQISTPLTRVWQCLTQPASLAQWFADADHFEPGRPFRLSVGDGDFFAGTIVERDEPGCLRLEWKFMDLGARCRVGFFLTPLAGPATELTVVDRGCLTLDEMNALREGWADFLGRLALHAETGQRARFTWSEAISMSAVVPGAAELPARLRAADWWRSTFPEARVRTHTAEDAGLRAEFRAQAWGDLATEARITVERVSAGACVSVEHQGFARLPDGVGQSERKRYAQRWQQALKSLEEGLDGEADMLAEHLAAPGRARGGRS